MQGLVNMPISTTVMPLVSRLAQHLSGALTAAKSAAVGARVLSVHTGGANVTPLKSRVDKLRTVRRTPGGLYWYLGLDNYAIWALEDSGSSYTLVSRGLCNELGLPVRTGGALGSYRVADG